MPNRVYLDIDEQPLQHIAPSRRYGGYEGIAFSSSGSVIGVAASEANAVLLFRRKDDCRFEDSPYFVLDGSGSGLDYPHDLAFCRCDARELLAVAQRARGISIYSTERIAGGFRRQPAFEISGPQSGLEFSDGVAFVPPDNKYVAACNLELSNISFYRRVSLNPIAYNLAPDFILKHTSIYRPDGLAFSPSGHWLAVANHADHSVVIFKRNRWRPFSRDLSYDSIPWTIIRNQQLRFPHSVTFSSYNNHLIVSNAGDSHICTYRPQNRLLPRQWIMEGNSFKVADDPEFSQVNSQNEMEGGAKGITIFRTNLAVCGQQLGIKIYSLRETRYLRKSKRHDYPMIVANSPELKPGTVVDFSISGKARTYIYRGWSQAEDWGTWSEGPRASLAFRLPKLSRDMKLRLLALGFEPAAGEPQVATVLVDDCPVSVIRLSPDARSVELDLPDSVLRRGADDHRLDFVIGAPTSPADRGLSADTRRLGIGIKSLTLVA